MINTSLEPLDLEQVQDLPKTKMTKALQNAWKIAAEKHDLEYFKGILKTWQEEEAQIEKEMREEDERQRKLAEEKALRDKEDAEKAAAEEATGKKKKSRKSKGGDEDVDMEDADAPKSAKKRKKDAESDAEGAKVRTIVVMGYDKFTNECCSPRRRQRSPSSTLRRHQTAIHRPRSLRLSRRRRSCKHRKRMRKKRNHR